MLEVFLLGQVIAVSSATVALQSAVNAIDHAANWLASLSWSAVL